MVPPRSPGLEALRIFEAVARLGGFTRAASEIGRSQSAVSLRMRDLQADLGVRLFAATRPKLILTPEGQRLAARIASGLQTIAEGVEQAREQRAPLQISVHPSFARWLTPRLRDFTAAHPAIAIELDVSIDLRPVGRPICDVAIRSGRGEWPGLAALPLMPVERTPMLAAALRGRLGPDPHPDRLHDLPLLYSEHWTTWLEAAGAPSPVLGFAPERFPTQDLLAEAAQSGAGVALLSPTLFQDRLASGALLAPFDLVLSGPDAYFAVYRADALSAQGEAFVRWLRPGQRKHRPV
jgi:LysR family transcriptional regulator, glycine cleavage system transcriptional activator